jgi:DNA primase
MSLIETMRNSSPSPQHQQGLDSVMLLQKLLTEFNPALQVEQSMLAVESRIEALMLRLESRIEQSIQRVEATAESYGELMAQELGTSSEALAQMTVSAQDAATEQKTATGKVDEQLTKSITTLQQADKVLKKLQAPKPVVKDHRPTIIIVLQGLMLLGITTDILLRLIPA